MQSDQPFLALNRRIPSKHLACTAISKKVIIVNSRYWKTKGTLGIVIMSDNAPAKVVTVSPWHYGEPALYIMQSQC